MNGTELHFHLLRNAHLFSNRPEAGRKLEKKSRAIGLAPDQLFHPQEPGDFIVRRGKLRVSQFLPDGREITRSVLQAGSVFRVREGNGTAETNAVSPEADRYLLADIVLMALGEGELWALPVDQLELKA